MKRLILGLAMTSLVMAKPELYREKEDFQYSRSSSDEGTKSGYYDAQRGNMGGNYEKAHNMDVLAQHQMGGLVRQVDGELGDGSNTRTGSVFSSANSRGIYGSGHYDLSNVAGRNFQEGVSYGDSHHASSSNSAYTAHSSSLKNERHSTSGHTFNSGLSAHQASNVQETQNLNDAKQYERGMQSGHSSMYNSQSGYIGQNLYGQRVNTDNLASQNKDYLASQNTGYLASQNTDSNSHHRLISTVPVKIIVRPGQSIAVPIATQTHSGTHSASFYDQNAVNNEAEVSSTNIHQQALQPTNTGKHYESSYRYHKEWEKHDTRPAVIPLAIPTAAPISNSELYDNSYALRGMQYSGTGNRYDQNSNYNSASSQSRYQTDFNARQQSLASSNSNLNGYIQSGSNANFDSQSANLVGIDSSKPKSYQSSYSYHKSWERQGDPYIIKPASNGISEDQTSGRLTDATAAQNAYTSYNYGSRRTQNQQRYTQNNCLLECEPSHDRVVRSYDSNYDDQIQQQSQNTDDFGQQTQTQWVQTDNFQQTQNKDNLEDFGQQTQDTWGQIESRPDHLENFGQQTQNKDNLEDLGQRTQDTWGQTESRNENFENFRQQMQNKDNLEDLGQQTQNTWGQTESRPEHFENFGQETQNMDNLKDLGQQTQDTWGQTESGNENFENFRQQMQNKDYLEDLGQQTQNTWGQKETRPEHFENFGQQTQNMDNLEDLGQQTQDTWGQTESRPDHYENFGQQTQNKDNLEDLGQQTQDTWGQTESKLEHFENFGQQTQNKDNLEDLGQQTQDTWGQKENNDHKFDNLGQQTQNTFDNLEDLGQQTQNLWNSDSTGTDTENQRKQLEDLGQQTQQDPYTAGQQSQMDYGQQTQDIWGKIEKNEQSKNLEFDQQTVNRWHSINTQNIERLQTSTEKIDTNLDKLSNSEPSQNSNYNQEQSSMQHSYQTNDMTQQTSGMWDKMYNQQQSFETNNGASEFHSYNFQSNPTSIQPQNTGGLNNLWGKLDNLDEGYMQPTTNNDNSYYSQSSSSHQFHQNWHQQETYQQSVSNKNFNEISFNNTEFDSKHLLKQKNGTETTFDIGSNKMKTTTPKSNTETAKTLDEKETNTYVLRPTDIGRGDIEPEETADESTTENTINNNYPNGDQISVIDDINKEKNTKEIEDLTKEISHSEEKDSTMTGIINKHETESDKPINVEEMSPELNQQNTNTEFFDQQNIQTGFIDEHDPHEHTQHEQDTFNQNFEQQNQHFIESMQHFENQNNEPSSNFNTQNKDSEQKLNWNLESQNAEQQFVDDFNQQSQQSVQCFDQEFVDFSQQDDKTKYQTQQRNMDSEIEELIPEPVNFEEQHTEVKKEGFKNGNINKEQDLEQANQKEYDYTVIGIAELKEQQMPKTEPSSTETTTEKPGFWRSVGNKFSNAKNKVSSWFGS